MPVTVYAAPLRYPPARPRCPNCRQRNTFSFSWLLGKEFHCAGCGIMLKTTRRSRELLMLGFLSFFAICIPSVFIAGTLTAIPPESIFSMTGKDLPLIPLTVMVLTFILCVILTLTAFYRIRLEVVRGASQSAKSTRNGCGRDWSQGSRSAQ